MKLPDNGLSSEQVMTELRAARGQDLDWRAGRCFAYIYDGGEEIDRTAKAAYLEFLSENALDPTVFPSLLRFEREVVAIGAAHLGGDPSTTYGSFTSGGTESIILAVKAARDWARTHRPEVTRPRMVIPVTAHAAFHKAAHYLCVELDLVEVDPETYQAGAEHFADAITDQTILLVGSAPGYPHGVCDDIEGIAALALERGLLMHTDACMGGWMLPFFKRLGAPVRPFDLSVPGVTSISMDLHKYAYCPKGASLVLYKDKELKKHQIFSCSGWTGYTIINPTVQSTKSGGPLAAAWATLRSVGDAGYMKLAEPVLDATNALVEGIRSIEGLKVMGTPEFCLIAVEGTEGVNAFQVVDEMNQRGWYLQPQLGLRRPDGTHYRPNFHISVNASTADKAGAMLADLREVVAAVKAAPQVDMAGQVVAALSVMDTSKMSDEAFSNLLSMAGIQGTELPERMATIHGLLDALPAELADRVLTVFFNELTHQP
jgi:sphinganine-1-phosphate aldolase